MIQILYLMQIMVEIFSLHQEEFDNGIFKVDKVAVVAQIHQPILLVTLIQVEVVLQEYQVSYIMMLVWLVFHLTMVEI